MQKENSTPTTFVRLLLLAATLLITVNVYAQTEATVPGPAMVTDEYSEVDVRENMRREGMPAATIDALIKERKAMFARGIKVERMSLNRQNVINSYSLKKNDPTPQLKSAIFFGFHPLFCNNFFAPSVS